MAGFWTVGDKEGILMRLFVVLWNVDRSVMKTKMGCLETDIVAVDFLYFKSVKTSYQKWKKCQVWAFIWKFCRRLTPHRRYLDNFESQNWDKLEALITIILMLRVIFRNSSSSSGQYISLEFLSLGNSEKWIGDSWKIYGNTKMAKPIIRSLVEQ